MPAQGYFPSGPDHYDAILSANVADLADRESFRRLVSKYVPKSHLVVDFGAGTGLDAAHFALDGYRVVLFEPDAAMSAAARRRVIERGVADRVIFFDGALEDLRRAIRTEAKAASVVSDFAPLNLVEDPWRDIPLLGDLVSPGGYLIAGVGNPYFFRHFLLAGISSVMANLWRTGCARSPFCAYPYHYLSASFFRRALPGFRLLESQFGHPRRSRWPRLLASSFRFYAMNRHDA